MCCCHPCRVTYLLPEGKLGGLGKSGKLTRCRCLCGLSYGSLKRVMPGRLYPCPSFVVNCQEEHFLAKLFSPHSSYFALRQPTTVRPATVRSKRYIYIYIYIYIYNTGFLLNISTHTHTRAPPPRKRVLGVIGEEQRDNQIRCTTCPQIINRVRGEEI
ncbi:hypothetical protein B0H66DRAFT_375796 [Apodospora peruviana]|uniref:Uncharacterized protein n=1 Tax=Apodospora peruviana TaxID=516989 RepID=A0AAE0M040_9PEZI|nr:hypothetical protein B0H66DRAFT_375796 [Apodospora peruviana]